LRPDLPNLIIYKNPPRMDHQLVCCCLLRVLLPVQRGDTRWKLRSVPPRMLSFAFMYFSQYPARPSSPVQVNWWRARSHTYFQFINSDMNLCKFSHISNKCTWHCVRKGKFNRTKMRYELWWLLLTSEIKQHHGLCIPPQAPFMSSSTT